MTFAKIGALALAVFSHSVPALADTLQLVSTGGASVDGVEIYPYNFSVDGSASQTSLMGINYNREITMEEA